MRTHQSVHLSLKASLLVLALLLARPAGAGTRVRFESGARARQLRLSSSGDHTCAVLDDGTVRCWGNNTHGELGDGTITTTPKTPVQVSGLTQVVSVSAGLLHTCALRADGSVWCWGSNSNGQFGNGTVTSSAVPVRASFENAIAVTVGIGYTCALRSDGTAWCFGSNTLGQLGLGSSVSGSLTPAAVPVPEAGSAVIAISAGGDHACAVVLDPVKGNFVRCWGSGHNGQLGNGAFPLISGPVNVSGLSGVIDIAAGDRHTCALLVDGTVRCWGLNFSGQLGDGFFGNQQASPVSVLVSASLSAPRPLTGAVAVSAGSDHSCAIVANGSAFCWGANTSGKLGDGTTNGPRPVASAIVLALARALEIVTGNDHSCAIEVVNGAVRCWGDNSKGQLGNGSISPSSVAVTVGGVAGSIGARGIGAGDGLACARRGNGTVSCWGADGNGQLGNGQVTSTNSPNPNPQTISGLNDAMLLSVGTFHSCVLQSSGQVSCWGSNQGGAITSNLVNSYPSPTTVPGISNATAISGAGDHTCAVLVDGTLRCWGANYDGQLGNSTVGIGAIFVSPVAVVDASLNPVSGVVMVSAAHLHSCALIVDGTVFCWGDNGSQELGDGGLEAFTSTPVKVVGLNNITAISAGDGYTCALSAFGGVSCWGGGSYGELGDSMNSTQPFPDAVSGLGDAVAIAAGTEESGAEQHTCAIRAEGSAVCWGSDRRDELGAADTASQHNSPVPVIFSFVTVHEVQIPFKMAFVTAMAPGLRFTCSLQAYGQPRCWGDNSFGQIGDGGTELLQARPTTVNSFTANVDPAAALESNSRIAKVTALVNCLEGEAHIFLTLEQGQTSGSGAGVAACEGGLVRVPLTVPAHGSTGWQPGPATAKVEAIVKDQGEIVEDQHWTRTVVLSFQP